MVKHGIAVYVDFFKINRPCNCIVTPLFVGQLLVTSRGFVVQSCNTQIHVHVQNGLAFGCPTIGISSLTTNVTIDQSVDVQAEYVEKHSSGTFYQCLGFQQNGKSNRYGFIFF